MNRTLKNIKLDVIIDFICSNVVRIIMITNKIAASLDLQSIEQYVKDTNHINSNKIDSSRLLQLKLYLKIISLPYF